MKKLIIPVLIIVSLHCQAEKYWLFLNEVPDKYKTNVTDEKTDYFKRVYPVLAEVEVLSYSIFLNALSVSASINQLEEIKTSCKFLNIVPVKALEYNIYGDFELSAIAQALHQMNATVLIDKGLTGKNIKIGLIDGGFRGAEKSPWLSHIFQSGRIAACRNFLSKDQECFNSKIQDDHGTSVWEAIAGKSGDRQIGMATESIFYLAHTDHPTNESKIEEDNWIAAIEWLHNEGVRLVNSSLGYSTGFDDPDENYMPKDIDGKSILSIAADEAAKRGMIIVSAAGNDGINNFKVVSVPSDANGLITVGATIFKHRLKASFSSVGPPHLPYLKPDISTFSASGTSFSAPAITGVIACLLELDSTLSVDSIKQLLISASHLYPYGNNYIGYGIPNIKNIFTPSTSQLDKIFVKGRNHEVFTTSPSVSVFHKEDQHQVIKQELLKTKNNTVRIKKPSNCKATTIWNEELLLEIIWE
ncbi:MAG: S8 family serine peptidase [Candidatus Cyclobacteriaceae bacterium M2_1C_046]